MAADVLRSVLIGLVLLVCRVSAQSVDIGLSQTNLILIIAACFATILILGGLVVTWYFWSKRRKARELEKKADYDKNMMLHMRSQYAGGPHAAVSHIGMPMHMAPQQAQWRWMPTELKAEQSAAFKIFSQPTVHTREREYPKIHHPSPKQHRRQPSPEPERRSPSPHEPRSPSPNRLQVPSVVVQSQTVDYPRTDDSQHLSPPPPTTTFPIFRPVTQLPPAANIPVPPPPPPIQAPIAPPPPPVPQAPLPPAVFSVTNVPPKRKTTPKTPTPPRSPSPKPKRKSEPTPPKMLKAAGPRPGPSPSPPRSRSPRPARHAPQAPPSPKPATMVNTATPKSEAPPPPKATPKPVQEIPPAAKPAPKNVPPPPPIPAGMKTAHPPTPQPQQQPKKPLPSKTQPAKPQPAKPDPVKAKAHPPKAASQPKPKPKAASQPKPKLKAQAKQKSKPKSKIPPKKADLPIQCDEEEIDKAMMPLKAADMKIDLSMFDPKEGTSHEPEEDEAVTSDMELTDEAERRVAALFDDIFTDERYTGGLALTSDSEDGAEDSPTRKNARYDDNWGNLDTSHSGRVKRKSTS